MSEEGKMLTCTLKCQIQRLFEGDRDMAEMPKDKPLVSHLARKTFACTIGLANVMNIGVLSKILGHASIQVTLDSYATVIDSLMLQNVRDMKVKLSSSGK